MFYSKLKSMIRQYNIQPENLWNCDERGITIGAVRGKHKAIVRAGMM